MKYRLVSICITMLIAPLFGSANVTAQMYQKWTAITGSSREVFIDADGNSYFYTLDYTPTPYPGYITFNIYKLDANGNNVWSRPFVFKNGSGGSVFVDSLKNTIMEGDNSSDTINYAKFSTDGNLLFESNLSFHGLNSINFRRLRHTDLYGNILYIARERLAVFGFVSADGTALWEDTFSEPPGYVLRSYIFAEGPDRNNEFLAYSRFDLYPQTSPPQYRTFLHKISINGGVLWSKEVQSKNRYHLGVSSAIYEHELVNGPLTTMTKRDANLNILWSVPAHGIGYENPYDSSVVYINDLDRQSCVNQDGSLRWVQPVGVIYPTQSIDLKGNIIGYVQADETVYCADRLTGDLKWSLKISFDPQIAPNFRRGTCRADRFGNIYVYDSRYVIKLSPLPVITVLDANKDALSDKELYLIRVADDAPLFTPDTLGIVKTDADGKIQLTPVP